MESGSQQEQVSPLVSCDVSEDSVRADGPTEDKPDQPNVKGKESKTLTECTSQQGTLAQVSRSSGQSTTRTSEGDDEEIEILRKTHMKLLSNQSWIMSKEEREEMFDIIREHQSSHTIKSLALRCFIALIDRSQGEAEVCSDVVDNFVDLSLVADWDSDVDISRNFLRVVVTIIEKAGNSSVTKIQEPFIIADIEEIVRKYGTSSSIINLWNRIEEYFVNTEDCTVQQENVDNQLKQTEKTERNKQIDESKRMRRKVTIDSNVETMENCAKQALIENIDMLAGVDGTSTLEDDRASQTPEIFVAKKPPRSPVQYTKKHRRELHKQKLKREHTIKALRAEIEQLEIKLPKLECENQSSKKINASALATVQEARIKHQSEISRLKKQNAKLFKEEGDLCEQVEKLEAEMSEVSDRVNKKSEQFNQMKEMASQKMNIAKGHYLGIRQQMTGSQIQLDNLVRELGVTVDNLDMCRSNLEEKEIECAELQTKLNELQMKREESKILAESLEAQFNSVRDNLSSKIGACSKELSKGQNDVRAAQKTRANYKAKLMRMKMNNTILQNKVLVLERERKENEDRGKEMEHILAENLELKRKLSESVDGDGEEVTELEGKNERLRKENEELMTLMDALLEKTEGTEKRLNGGSVKGRKKSEDDVASLIKVAHTVGIGNSSFVSSEGNKMVSEDSPSDSPLVSLVFSDDDADRSSLVRSSSLNSSRAKFQTEQTKLLKCSGAKTIVVSSASDVLSKKKDVDHCRGPGCISSAPHGVKLASGLAQKLKASMASHERSTGQQGPGFLELSGQRKSDLDDVTSASPRQITNGNKEAPSIDSMSLRSNSLAPSCTEITPICSDIEEPNLRTHHNRTQIAGVQKLLAGDGGVLAVPLPRISLGHLSKQCSPLKWDQSRSLGALECIGIPPKTDDDLTICRKGTTKTLATPRSAIKKREFQQPRRSQSGSPEADKISMVSSASKRSHTGERVSPKDKKNVSKIDLHDRDSEADSVDWTFESPPTIKNMVTKPENESVPPLIKNSSCGAHKPTPTPIAVGNDSPETPDFKKNRKRSSMMESYEDCFTPPTLVEKRKKLVCHKEEGNELRNRGAANSSWKTKLSTRKSCSQKADADSKGCSSFSNVSTASSPLPTQIQGNPPSESLPEEAPQPHKAEVIRHHIFIGVLALLIPLLIVSVVRLLNLVYES